MEMTRKDEEHFNNLQFERKKLKVLKKGHDRIFQEIIKIIQQN